MNQRPKPARHPIYNVVKLRWVTRQGVSEMRQGNAATLAKRLERLRCEATLSLLDGTVIGGCEHSDRFGRLKWHWWYDKDALISHYEKSRYEESIERQTRRTRTVWVLRWKTDVKRDL